MRITMRGPTTDEIWSTQVIGCLPKMRCSQPVGMNNVVMMPKAMNAPRFGMTIPARKAPNRCTAARGPVPVTVGV